MSNDATAVLLIEDDPSDALLVSGLLRPRPGRHFESEFAVTHADSLEQALALIARHSFQAILCDLSLPDSQGLSTFRRIRAAAPDVPLLILTGHDSDTLARNAIHEGAQDFLDKNHLDSHSLPRAIRYAMERKRLELERDRAEHQRLRSEEYSREILSSLAAHIAVIDSDGTILTVNRAWEQFARANGDPLFAHTAPGVNYIDVCYRAAQAGNRTAAEVIAGLQAVLVGSRPHFQIEYDCHSPAEQRWFTMHAAPLYQDRTRLVITHENITSRVQAEQALRQSEARYRSLAEAAHDQIFIINRNLKVEYVNTAAAQAFGLEPAAVTGRALQDLFPLPIFERLAAGVRRVMETRAPVYGETLTPFPGGERWLGTQLAPLQNEAGEVTGVLGIARDITDRKLAEAACEQSERLFRSLIENSADAIAMLDADGKLLRFATAAAHRLLGYSIEEVAGRDVREIVHPEDQAVVNAMFDRLRQEPAAVVLVEVRLPRRDGSWRWVEAAVSNRLADPAVAAIVANFRDITARKEADALQQYQATLLAHATDAIAATDENGVVRIWNKAAETLLGYTAEEVIGQPGAAFFSAEYPGSDLNAVMEQLRQTGSWKGEIRARRKDGSWIDMAASITAINDSAGRFTGYLTISHDITALKESERALIRQADELTVLHAAAEAGNRAASEDELFENVTRIIGATLYSHHFGVMVLNPEENALLVHPSHQDRLLHKSDRRVPLGEGVTGWVAATGRPKRVADVRTEPRYRAASPETLSELCVPIQIDSRIYGVINVESEQLNAFTESDERLLMTLARQLATAIEKLRLLEALRLSENKYRTIAEQLPVILYEVAVSDPPGPGNRTTYISPQVEAILGYTPEEWLAEDKIWIRLLHPDDRERVLAEVYSRRDTEQPLDIEYRSYTRDGRVVWLRNRNRFLPAAGGQPARLYGVMFDITGLKQAEEALRESEAVFRRSIEAAGAVPYRRDYRANRYVYIGEGIRAITGYSPEEFTTELLESLIVENQPGGAARGLPIEEALRLAHAGQLPNWRNDLLLRTRDGSLRWVADSSVDVRDESGAVTGSIGMLFDITDRKQAEEAMRRSEERFRLVARATNDAIWDWDLRTGAVWRNKVFYTLFGYSESDIGPDAETWKALIHPADRDRVWESIHAAIASGQEYWQADYRFRRADGSYADVQDRGYIVSENGRPVRMLGSMMDVTEQKQRTRELEAIAILSTTLRTATTPSDMLPVLLDKTLELLRGDSAAIGLVSPGGDEMVKVLGRGELGSEPNRVFHRGEGIGGRVWATGQPYVTNDLQNDPQVVNVAALPTLRSLACVPLIAHETTLGVLWVGRSQHYQQAASFAAHELRLLSALADIAANALRRAALHDETRRQVRRLQALRTIDEAVSASLDLRFTLNVLLLQAVEQLQVDAACVLLLNPHTQVLEYAAGQGFRTRAIERAAIRLGQGVAGQAAFTRRPTGVIAINDPRHNFSRRALLADEGFVGYYGIPIVGKGALKGMLEVFSRSPLQADADWENFITTIAHQSAIAIENIALYEDLQRTNIELSLAYDTTLEGWSRALDLRDEETEGHSQRVTDRSVQLARVLGLAEADIVHLRRGALLHDIGKMGVPDSILRKPGSLTEGEWAIMRKHPQYAFDLLHPIPFLRPAIDIPYCHHEKWDGTGYPRGLKGLEIPLAARIFAVVDVWDALTSDRPYRSAWPADKVRAHLLAQSGKHFDPRVVEAFLPLIP